MTWCPRLRASEAIGKWVLSGVKMITAEPLGRARRAFLSKRSQNTFTPIIFIIILLTSLSIPDSGFRESPKVQVESLVHIANVLLEVFADFRELWTTLLSISRSMSSSMLTLPPFVPDITIL